MDRSFFMMDVFKDKFEEFEAEPWLGALSCLPVLFVFDLFVWDAARDDSCVVLAPCWARPLCLGGSALSREAVHLLSLGGCCHSLLLSPSFRRWPHSMVPSPPSLLACFFSRSQKLSFPQEMTTRAGVRSECLVGKG